MTISQRRRLAMIGAAVILGAGALGACGSDDTDSATTQTTTQTTGSPTTPTGSNTISVNEEQDRDALLAAMKEGGVVIYFRHGATDRGGYDDYQAPRSEQRLLSEEGQEQSRTIGEAFKANDIDASRILTSPYERNKDMAELAFGRSDGEEVNLLGEGERSDLDYSYLMSLFSEPLEPGKNLVIFSHSDPLRAVTGVSLPEGGAVVVRPGPDPVVLGSLTPEDWSALAG